MIIINAPTGSNFQVKDFGSITFEYPIRDGGQPSTDNGATIDEIIYSNSGYDDITTQIDFIKRYNTWFAFTNVSNSVYAEKPGQLIFINYDRVNKVAYTHTEDVLIKPYRM